MSTTTFAELEAEYETAKAEASAATRRLRVVAKAWMDAQCGVVFATFPGERTGYTHRYSCTLEAGHDGEHSNVYTRAGSAGGRP